MTVRETGRFGRRALVIVFCALGLVSCSEDVTGPSDLQGGVWRLRSMETETGGAFEPSDRSRFTVEFKADGTIGVRADCNQCGGTYSVSGGRLTVGPLVCTLIACPTAQGQQFAALLDGNTSVDADGDGLEIESADGTLEFTH
jgi:heat shock protein HslJ